MENKECQVICEGKEIATLNCSKDGFSIKFTNEGKEMCKDHCKDCC
ncbi:hypothetical protein GOV12_06350 [Candidatus Pacearchaeota archaeon]|nr:hypothetical protein [Candidatus Pacearchaeota archaeon]